MKALSLEWKMKIPIDLEHSFHIYVGKSSLNSHTDN